MLLGSNLEYFVGDKTEVYQKYFKLMRDPCTQVECYRSDFGLLKSVSLCRLQRKGVGDGIAAGLTTKVSQLIVRQGALLLRKLLYSPLQMIHDAWLYCELSVQPN